MMPPVEVLRECFEFEPSTGMLTWRTRPVWHFTSPARAAWWNGRWAGTPALQSSQTSYGHRGGCVTIQGVQHKLLAHRVIWSLIHDRHPGAIVSHWDRDAGQNDAGNLRASSRSQSSRDSMRRKPGLKGAYRTASGKWRSCVWAGGKQRHLGTFTTEQAAHEAWVVANVKVAGRFFNAGYPTVFD